MADEGKVHCPAMVKFNRRCIRVEGHGGVCGGAQVTRSWSLRMRILSRGIPVVRGVRRTRSMPCRDMSGI